MLLKTLVLQHFRSYEQAKFTFHKDVTLIVGPNTAGKTNLLEAIYLLSSGKSFRADKDTEMIGFGREVARVKGKITDGKDEEILEVMITQQEGTARSFSKKFLINNVPKRRVDFAGFLTALLFIPADLDIIIGSPSLRRNFLDSVLEQTDRAYHQAHLTYTRALRQRNALLELVREKGIRSQRQFEYWDELLITNGQLLSAKREAFIDYINGAPKDLIQLNLFYDKSLISEQRLLQYKDAEAGAGITLVGPHRDDIGIFLLQNGVPHDVKLFGSRGQQRLAILQLKLLQLTYLRKLEKQPILILDDIFSELDTGHIDLVMDVATKQQTIITTTHKDFLRDARLTGTDVVELKKV